MAKRLVARDKSLSDTDIMEVVDVVNADRYPAGKEYSVDAARLLMKFYPRTDLDDPITFYNGVSDLLSEYPCSVIDYVTSPVHGIPRKQKYLPRIAEIAEACDEEMKFRQTIRDCATSILWHRHRNSPDDYVTFREFAAKTKAVREEPARVAA